MNEIDERVIAAYLRNVVPTRGATTTSGLAWRDGFWAALTAFLPDAEASRIITEAKNRQEDQRFRRLTLDE